MILFLSIPIGLLCLVVSWLCFRVDRKKQAVAFSLIGLSTLVFAAAVAYWSNVLIQELAPAF